MPQVTIICPHCQTARAVDAAQVPPGLSRVTCRQCGKQFPFSPPDDPAPDESSAPPPRPDLPPLFEPIPELTRVGALFTRSWDIFVARPGVLLPLYLISLALTILPAAIPLGVAGLFGLLLGNPWLFLGGGAIVAILCASLGMSWGFLALLCAVVDADLDIGGALRRGWEKLWPFLWVLSLVGFFILGGLLLAVIPGLIFGVWYFGAQFVLLTEGISGLAALRRSHDYVRGRFWPVCGRLAAFWGVALAVSTLLGAIPMAGPLISLVLTPFGMIFTWLLFCDLQRLGPAVPGPRPTPLNPLPPVKDPP